MFDIVITALLLLGYVVIILLLVLMCLAPLNRLRYRGFQFDDTYEPTFALIVPAHNEGGVIERTIRLFLETDYPVDKKEMIIVNDEVKRRHPKSRRKICSKNHRLRHGHGSNNRFKLQKHHLSQPKNRRKRQSKRR